MSTLLFWDIDGTLLSTDRAGVVALEDAAREVAGGDHDLTPLHTSGLTDWQVAQVSLASCGLPDPDTDAVIRFLESYETHLPERLLLKEGRVMPNVREILALAGERDDVTNLLLTGNTPRGAAAKLHRFGLDGFFDGGAFCAVGEDRLAIAGRARTMAAERLGADVAAERTYLIGDTPSDVHAAAVLGARSVAVATGGYTRAELGALDPWVVLDELPAREEFAALVGLAPRGAIRQDGVAG